MVRGGVMRLKLYLVPAKYRENSDGAGYVCEHLLKQLKAGKLLRSLDHPFGDDVYGEPYSLCQRCLDRATGDDKPEPKRPREVVKEFSRT